MSDEIKISKKGTRFCFSKPEHLLYFQYAEQRTWINDCKITSKSIVTQEQQIKDKLFWCMGLPTKIAETLMNLFLINTFESAKLIQIAWNEVTLLLPSLFCSDWYRGLEFFKIWRLHAVISFRKFWWTVRFVLSHFVWKMRITVWTFVLPSIFAHFIKNCDPKHAEYDKRQFRQSLHQSVSYFL